jgi:hypothetical protein
MQARIAEVPEESLIHINLDIATVVTTAVGAMDEILALRPQATQQLPTFDLNQFDILEHAANATLHLHSRWLFANSPVEPLPELVREATHRRELLVSAATMLMKHGLLPANALHALVGPVGHKNVAVDLNGVASLLRENWTRIDGKTPLTIADLDAATRVAQRLIKAVGVKQQAPAVVAANAQERQRALTHFLRAYDQVRRSVIYLRWNEGDADHIAPSLYAGRSVKRKNGDEPSGEVAIGEDAVSEVPGATEGKATAAKPAAAKAPAGDPDSDPYSA